jgi:hypothetical protein
MAYIKYSETTVTHQSCVHEEQNKFWERLLLLALYFIHWSVIKK